MHPHISYVIQTFILARNAFYNAPYNAHRDVKHGLAEQKERILRNFSANRNDYLS